MVSLKILIPEATTNHITNPNIRYDTTGWNAQGSTISRTLVQARFGVASLSVVTNGAALREGAYFRVSSLSGISNPITVSAYVRGTGKVRIRLDNNVVGGREFFSPSVVLQAESWQRVSVSGFSTGGNDLRLYIETDESVAVVRTFYVDGAQLERKANPTTFCDGDQPGCIWNGLEDGSTSQRTAATRAGGMWVELAGPQRESEDLYMTVIGGLGQAPITNNIQNFALAPGGYSQNHRIGMRVITLSFHAKHKIDDRDEPVSLDHLHQLRQMLIDFVKPDLTAGDEDILFEYSDGTIPLLFKARYDGGLEGEWDIRNQFVNSFPLRLLATNPVLWEDSQESAALDFQESIFVKHAFARINGVWSNLNSGFNNVVKASALGPRKQVYMAGDFTLANNGATAIDPSRTTAVAYWDGEKWVSIAVSANNQILALAVAPNGDVYAAGQFTTINGVAANRIARYDGSTWSALGTGVDNNANCVVVAPNGDVYVGGTFVTAGGVSCFRIARWDGLQWRRLGALGGLNNNVTALSFAADGSALYVGGTFTGEQGGGVTLTKIAAYNVSAGTFAAMGNGITGTIINTILVSRSGIIYAAGDFTGSGSNLFENIAQWNGSDWTGLGAGLDDAVNCISELDNGSILAVGAFLNSGILPVSKIAIYNGSTWTNLDSKLVVVNSEILYTCLTNGNDIYIGGIFNNPGTAKQVYVSGITEIENVGSMEVAPVIYARGPALLRWLENQGTQKRIYLNLSILSGEDVMIDLQAGTIESAIRGSLFYGLVAGSDFRAFKLVPGNNTIAAFMTNDTGATLQLYYTPQHWSVDATARLES